MIATTPTQEQVDQLAKSLAPDVVRIRFRVDHDWSGHPAVYFKVVLSDEASKKDRLGETAQLVRQRIEKDLALDNFEERIPYVRFRSLSEQEKIREASWE